MTQVYTAHIGSYPRIGEQKDQQRHRRALTHLQDQEISQHGFRDVEQSVIQELVNEQISTGIDEITDGQASWHDPISHFCRTLSHIRWGGLARYFDNNFYYRIPIFTGQPKKKSPIVADEYSFCQGWTTKPLRAVLTGPLTLACHSQSEIQTFNKVESRMAFFTSLLQEEIKTVVERGAQIIQIDEPSLPKMPEYIPKIQKAFAKIFDYVRPNRVILSLYFSPLSSLLPALYDLPVDVLNLDFSADGRKIFEQLTDQPSPKALGFGILNARSTKLEPLDSLLKYFRPLLSKWNPPFMYVTPSSGLEFVPRQNAMEKLSHLVKLKDDLQKMVNENG